MSTIADSQARVIEPSTLYPLDEAMRRLGWGRHAMRKARREGLRVRYVGRTGFVKGSDIIAFIERTARDEK